MANYNTNLTWKFTPGSEGSDTGQTGGKMPSWGTGGTDYFNFGWSNLVHTGNTLTFNYDFYVRQTSTQSYDRWAVTSSDLGISNGTIKGYGSSYTQYPLGYYNYSNNNGGTSTGGANSYGNPKTATITLDAASTSVTITLNIKNTGLSTNWDNTSYSVVTKKITISNIPPGMTIDGTVTNGTAVGSVDYSATASLPGQTISSYAWNIGGQTFTESSSTSSGTLSGVTANSNVAWSVTATSSGGTTASTSGTVVTKHNPPELSGGTWSNEVRSSGTYTGDLTYSRSYKNGTGFSSHSLVYGTTTSYGTTATDPGSGTTWSISGLEPNKKYYWKATETDNGLIAGTSTLTGDFTTSGNAPSIYSVSTSVSTNSATITWSESFDTNASLRSRSFRRKEDGGEWTAWSSLSGRTAQPNNLKGYTKYYYEIKLVDNWGRETVYSSNFTTRSYVPRNIVLYGAEVGATTLRLAWTYDAPAGDPVTKTEIAKDNSSFVTITGTTYEFTNITPDTDHTFKIRLTNNYGVAYSDTILLTSVMGNLQMAANVTAPSFDQVQIQASAAVAGTTKTLKYRFSNDNGVTWTAEQSSGNYTFTGLTEETTYNIVTEVRAIHTGTYSGDAYNYEYDTITTPADQAKVRLKTSGSWVTGKAWIKVGGVWKKAKKVYVKKNGEWVLNKNG